MINLIELFSAGSGICSVYAESSMPRERSMSIGIKGGAHEEEHKRKSGSLYYQLVIL